MTTTTGGLPALTDIPVNPVPGVTRIENVPKQEAEPLIMEMLRSVYPHERVYGDFIPVQSYIASPPREVYDYLADTRSLEEWTYCLRGFQETGQPGLWVCRDLLSEPDPSHCYCRVVANPSAMTVDYHCAWDQGDHLWMIYVMRVLDAEVVLGQPGSVVTWINCRHPFYDDNPYQQLAPAGREAWVGDYWDLFPAGHQLELDNLKAICEYRTAHGLPVKPGWMG